MIPKFDIYHEGLHSSYIYFDRYKLFLQNQTFNGYIKLDDNQTQCFFFIKAGKFISSFWVSGHTIKEFSSLELPSVLKQPFFVSSYTVPQQVVDFFARCNTAKSIYDNFSFDSVDFDKFFLQIESKKITGFLEASRNSEPKKYIYFYNGKIFGYMNIKGKDGVFEHNLDKSQIQSALKNSMVTVCMFSSVVASKQHQSSPTPFAANHLSSKSDTASAKSISSTSASDDKNRTLALKCYEEIFQMLEMNTAPADFTSIWRTSAIELSNKYIFLNPFAGEFNYENNKIDLWEKVDTKLAIHALDELINSIAKKANLPKDGIKAIKDNYSNILVTYEIRN
ncbi:MAG: hypothetical protein HQK67_01815 [Desulfamplus sp.]|nr:hypothetical protein [Desulfamplus sp.]